MLRERPIISARLKTLVVLLFLIPPTLAEAQFLTLNRNGAGNAVELSTDLVLVNSGENSLLRTDLFAQMMMSPNFGQYVSLPFTKGFDLRYGDSTSLGNLEMGLLIATSVGPIELSFRLGALLPTGTSSDQSIYYASAGRVNNRMSYTHDALAGGRFDITARYSSGRFFAQGDVGVDIHGRMAGDVGGQAFFGVRANFAVGLLLGLLQMTLESVNYGEEDIGSGEMRFTHSLATGVRFALPHIQPYAGVIVPIDDDHRKTVVLTIGARGVF
jgi:hypothetical protein